MRFFPWLLPLVLATAICPVHAQREKIPPDDLAIVMKRWPDVQKTNTGIRYIIEKPGEGKPPNPGDLVSVIYEGRLLNGTVFDKVQDRAHPLQFRVGRDMVIDGWDQILKLMKLGEKRLVIIPPELGYGTRGHDPAIPPDSTLVFEMELVKIERVQ